MEKRKSYRERAWERREQEILRVAGEIIRERGYEALNMDDLAAAVGISKPTLYRHFADKEDMIARTIVKGTRHILEYVQGLEEGTPLARLEKVMRYIINLQYAREGFSTTLVQPYMLRVHREHPDFLAVGGDLDKELRGLIEAARAAGEIRADVSEKLVVGGMFSLLMMFEDTFGPPMTDAEFAALVDEVVGFYLRGIGANT